MSRDISVSPQKEETQSQYLGKPPVKQNHGKEKKTIPPGQIPLPFAFKSPESAISHPEIKTVALPFIKANRYTF